MSFRSQAFFDELPAGYREIRLYDVNSRRFKLITGPVSFAVSLIIAALVFASRIRFSADNLTVRWHPLYLLHVLTVIALIVGYTVLHELTHGLVYKILTGRKLSFGFFGSMAYCGLPGVYVRRNVAAASCIAPFVVFTAVFAVLLYALPVNIFWFVLLIAFMNHIGGCFADLYAFAIMLRRGKDLLMLDNGKDQHVFVKDNGAAREFREGKS